MTKRKIKEERKRKEIKKWESIGAGREWALASYATRVQKRFIKSSKGMKNKKIEKRLRYMKTHELVIAACS